MSKLKKITTIFVLAVSIITAVLIVGIFALNITHKDKIYTANVILHDSALLKDSILQNDFYKITARINFSEFAPLLRSTRIAKLYIHKYHFNDDINKDLIFNLKNSGRNLYFNTSYDLSHLKDLGSLEYSIDFMPFIKTILRYYIAILSLIALFLLGNKIMQDSSFQIISFRVGISFFAFVASLFIMASLGFIIKISIINLYFYASLLLSLWILLYKNPHKIKSILLYVIFAVASAFMAFYYYDDSWDGRAYHQIGIYYLANHYNPIYHQMADLADLRQFLSHQIWIEHYLKFAEITQACVYRAFGFIESGKLINYLFAFGAFLYGIAVLNKLRFFHIAISVLLSFLAVFSPVVMTQIGTYYVDGLLGIAIIFIVLSILDLEIKTARYKYVIFIVALCVAGSIKLTGIAYAGFIGISYLCYKIYTKNHKDSKNILLSGAISIMLIMCCNINPLLTNQIHHGHFGYPLMGKDSIDIISSQQPQNFNGNNRFEKLAKSLFSKTQNISKDGTSTLKFPFIKTKNENLNSPDTRIAGFGYFFSGIIVLCFAFVLINMRHFYHRIFLFCFGVILGSILINSESWWARYVPQMWLLPFIVIIFSYSFSVNKISKILRNMIIFLWILSFLAVANSPISSGYKNTINSQLANIKTSDEILVYLPLGFEKSFGVKLLERGYKMQILDKEAFEKISQEKPFYPLLNVLDNYNNLEAFWSVEPSKINIKD